MKRVLHIFIGVALIFIILTVLSPAISADRGMMPIVGTVKIYEPGQKAIIGWNGNTELLILATDVYGDSNTSVLEVIPLPSEPKIELGNISSFTAINRLISNQYYDNLNPRQSYDSEGIEVVFHEQLGSHNLMVIKVNDYIDFQDWIIDFKTKNGIENTILPPKMNDLILNYLEHDINYFAFDIIDVTKDKKSVEPIIYLFDVDYLYYPLEISSIVNGDTEIYLFTLTKPGLNDSQIIDLGFDKKIDFKISSNDLLDINEYLLTMFDDEILLSSYKYSGSLQGFQGDIMVGYVPKSIQDQDNVEIIPPDFEPIKTYYWLIYPSAMIILITCLMVFYVKDRKYNRSKLEPRIIEHLENKPGDYFTHIKKALDTSNGNLSYIINKLERAQIIKSRQFGQKRRFFLYDYPVNENFFLSKVQFDILDIIRRVPGLPQKDFAYICGLSSRNFYYHTQILLNNGYIFTVSDGKKKRYFPIE
jgi:DNA-binding MarR family transcriptional regulator